VAGAGFDTPLSSARNTGYYVGRNVKGNVTPFGIDGNVAESVAGCVLADPLLGRLAAAWPELGDADRAAVVELAQRLSGAVRDGVAVNG
jgi:hypothetical protein